MPTKEEIQVWAREEWARLDREKTESIQAACTHARSGTQNRETREIACDDCDKIVTLADR